MPECKIPFVEFFSAYQLDAAQVEQLSAWQVCQASINPKERTMAAKLECPLMPEERLISKLERDLAAAYGLCWVKLSAMASAEAAKEEMPAPPREEKREAEVPDDPFARTEAIRRAALEKLRQKAPDPKGKEES